MQINSVNNYKTNTNFNGFYNNKTLIKGLKFASDNGAFFGVTTAVLLSTFVRPLVILSTPNVDKRDKEYACVKSVASSAVKLGMIAGVSLPIVSALNNIEKNPQKFLSEKSIKFLKNGTNSLKNSATFNFLSNGFKLSSAFLTLIPKAFLSCALIPPIMLYFFGNEKPKKQPTSKISFSGKLPTQNIYQKFTEKLSKGFAKIIEKQSVQDFANKYKDTNLAQHIFSLNDLLAIGLFMGFTAKSKEIEENRKKTLLANTAFCAGITIAGSYVLSKLLEKPTEKFIKNFEAANKNLPDVKKYANGVKTAKAAFLLGGLYYVVSPLLATILADKYSKNRDK